MPKEPKYRRPLNPNQLKLLQFIYKFRFITAPLLTEVIGSKTRVSVFLSLQILEEQGYIAKRYESSYRLLGKQASYYLLPRGLKELQARFYFSEQVLRSMYNNKRLSDSFIDHNLDVLKAYISLQKCYPKAFHIFTKYELGNFEYFPNPKPDLYLNRIKHTKELSNEYLLDIFTEEPPFVVRKRAGIYIRHIDTDNWQDETGENYPTVLIACPTSRSEEGLQKHIVKRLEENEINFMTTTSKALLNDEPDIWSNIDAAGTLISLD